MHAWRISAYAKQNIEDEMVNKDVGRCLIIYYSYEVAGLFCWARGKDRRDEK